jgi:hypothetical protein
MCWILPAPSPITSVSILSQKCKFVKPFGEHAEKFKVAAGQYAVGKER